MDTLEWDVCFNGVRLFVSRKKTNRNEYLFREKNNEEQLFLTAKYAKIAKGGDDFIEIKEEQLLICRW